VRKQDRSHQSAPYPLNCHSVHKAIQNYPRFCCISCSNCLEATAFGKCPVSAPSTEIKLETYYASVKQQERNYFRQLKLLRSEIYEPASRCSTCLLTSSTCCRNQTVPFTEIEVKFTATKVVFFLCCKNCFQNNVTNTILRAKTLRFPAVLFLLSLNVLLFLVVWKLGLFCCQVFVLHHLKSVFVH